MNNTKFTMFHLFTDKVNIHLIVLSTLMMNMNIDNRFLACRQYKEPNYAKNIYKTP